MCNKLLALSGRENKGQISAIENNENPDWDASCPYMGDVRGHNGVERREEVEVGSGDSVEVELPAAVVDDD